MPRTAQSSQVRLVPSPFWRTLFSCTHPTSSCSCRIASARVTSLGNNLIGNPAGCDVSLQPGDLTGDPGLDVFTDDGTPGSGHFPLLPTSQAIDAGSDDV